MPIPSRRPQAARSSDRVADSIKKHIERISKANTARLTANAPSRRITPSVSPVLARRTAQPSISSLTTNLSRTTIEDSKMPLDSSRIPRPMKMVARPRRHLVWSAPPSFIPGPLSAAASSRLGGVSRPVPLKSCLRAPGSGSTSKSVSFPDNYLTEAEIRFYELDGPLPRYPWTDPYFRRQFGSWPHQRSISSVSPVDGKDYCIRFDGNYQEPRTTGKFGSDGKYRKRCCPYCLSLRSQGGWTPIPEISMDLSGCDYQEEHWRRSQLILCDECAEDA